MFYIDIDAFERRDLGTLIYYFKFSLVFNRMFNEVEIKYWSTEFEMAGLIWVVRKIRHMIKATKTEEPTVIFTDHSVDISIAKQTT